MKSSDPSIYFNPSLVVERSRQPSDRKMNYKIEYINQDLEDAIKQMKEKVKENPQWKINLKEVTSQYKKEPSYKFKDKEKQQIKNQQKNQDKNENPNANVQSNQSEKHESNLQNQKSSLQFERTNTKRPTIMFTTVRHSQLRDQYLEQLKEKRMKLQAASLEKQIQAKLSRKIAQNLQLKRKMALLQQIQQHRQQSQALKQAQNKRKKQQERMLHESVLAKTEMIRKFRKRTHKRELTQNKSLQQESFNELVFKAEKQSKQKMERQNILRARYQSLRCIKTSSSFRSRNKITLRSQNNDNLSRRTIQTSQTKRD